jgi:hypothetical protein
MLGEDVQCPACDSVFIARLTDAPHPRTYRLQDEHGDPAREERRQPRRDDDEYDNRDYRRRDRRDRDYRYREPHRGAAVLTLGIIGLVLSCIPLAGWILGGIALSMGGSDLASMDRGRMDDEGRGSTQAGRICGVIAVVLSTVFFVLGCIFRVGALGLGAGRGRF